jgi:hypothetical protein
MKLKTGDIVLVHTKLSFNPKTWLSWAIRQFCATRYNHCGVIVDNYGALTFNEAVAHGIRPIPLDIALEGKRVIIMRDPDLCRSKMDELKMAIKANAYWGHTPYDWYTLLITFPIYILFGKWIGKSGPSADKKQVCSEYVANCIGMPTPYKVSPYDVLYYPKLVVLFEGTYTRNERIKTI